MSPDQLQKIMPAARINGWYSTIAAAMLEFHITNPERQAAFLANIAVESGQLQRVSENLRYSATRLATVWPTRYANKTGGPNPLALCIESQPEAIANNVYANRMGNGDEASGDGWRYRGSGLLQATGKAQHLAMADAFAVPSNVIGEWLRTAEGAARSAARIWMLAGCNEAADLCDFDKCCDLINIGHHTERHGDAIGFHERLDYFKTACRVLGAKCQP